MALLIPQSDLSQWRQSCDKTGGDYHQLQMTTVAKLLHTGPGALSPTATTAATPAVATPSTSQPQQQAAGNQSNNTNNSASSSPHGALPSMGSFSAFSATSSVPGSGFVAAAATASPNVPSSSSSAALIAQGEYCFVAVVPTRAAVLKQQQKEQQQKSNNVRRGSEENLNNALIASEQQQQQTQLLNSTSSPDSAIVVWSRDATAISRVPDGVGHGPSEGPILGLSAVESCGRCYSLFATSTATSIVVWLVRPLASPPSSTFSKSQQQQNQHQQQQNTTTTVGRSPSKTPPQISGLPIEDGASTPKLTGIGSNSSNSHYAPPRVLFDVIHVALHINNGDGAIIRCPTLFVTEPVPIHNGGMFVTADVLFFADTVEHVVAQQQQQQNPSGGNNKNNSNVFATTTTTWQSPPQQQQVQQQKAAVTSEDTAGTLLRAVCRAGVGLALPAVNEPPIVQFEKPFERLQVDRSPINSRNAALAQRASKPLMAAMPPLFAFSVSDDAIVTSSPDSCSTTPSWTPCEDCPDVPLIAVAWLPMASFAVVDDASNNLITAQSNAVDSSATSSSSSRKLQTAASQYKRLVCATPTRIVISRVGSGGQPEKLQKIVNGNNSGMIFRSVSCSFEGKIWVRYSIPQNQRSLQLQEQQQQQLHLIQHQNSNNNIGERGEQNLLAVPTTTPASAIQLFHEITCISLPVYGASSSSSADNNSNNASSGFSRFGRFSGGGGGVGGVGELASTALQISDKPARLPNSQVVICAFQQKFSPTCVGPQLFMVDALRRRLSFGSLQVCVDSTQPLPSGIVIPRHVRMTNSNSNIPGGGEVSGGSLAFGSFGAAAAAGKKAAAPGSGGWAFGTKSAFAAPISSSATTPAATAAAPSSAPPSKAWKFGSAAPNSFSGTPSPSPVAASSASASVAVPSKHEDPHTQQQQTDNNAPPSADLLFGADSTPVSINNNQGGTKFEVCARDVVELLRQRGLLRVDSVPEQVLRDIADLIERGVAK